MTDNSVIERHIMSVLARVIGLFSGRGYNIESLTVSETDPERALSRISIVTSGTPMVIEQIKAQLARLVPIHAGKSASRRFASPILSAHGHWTARWIVLYLR